jgi:rubrerythrin
MRSLYVVLFYVVAAFAGLAALAFLGIAGQAQIQDVRVYFGAMGVSAVLSAALLIGRAGEAEAVFETEKQVKLLRAELRALAERPTQQTAANPDLVSCRLCGSQISKKVPKCPHCQTIQPTQEA